MAAGRSEQSSCFSNYARHHEEQFNKIKSENWNQKWDIFCCEEYIPEQESLCQAYSRKKWGTRKCFATSKYFPNCQQRRVWRSCDIFRTQWKPLGIISSSSRTETFHQRGILAKHVRLSKWDKEGANNHFSSERVHMMIMAIKIICMLIIMWPTLTFSHFSTSISQWSIIISLNVCTVSPFWASIKKEPVNALPRTQLYTRSNIWILKWSISLKISDRPIKIESLGRDL